MLKYEETIPSYSELQDIDEKGASETYYYNQSNSSRFLCIAGLSFSWTISVILLVLGALISRGANLPIYNYAHSDRVNIFKETFIPVQTIILSIIREVLGYIHTISLRWALHCDGRLEFTSNLRLWQSANAKGPNAWYSNLIMILGQIVTFGSSAMTIVRDTDPNQEVIWSLGSAWITLGLGIAMQPAIATWSLWSCRNCPTWSSNPLDVAAACLQQSRGSLAHHPGRALHGLHHGDHPPMAMLPSRRQQSAYKVHKDVRKVTAVIWLMVGLCLIWAATVLIVQHHHQPEARPNAATWKIFDDSQSAIIIPLCCSDPSYFGFTANDFLWLFTLICILQSIPALSTHCAELHVNLIRDEAIWRKIGREKGYKRTSRNALRGFLVSWQAPVLFVLKIGVQWIFGLTFSLYVYNGMYLYGPQTLYLVVAMLVLAVFATSLVLMRPKGPQPTTYGHLQTLVDLIDEWPGENERMYWGDKGEYLGEAYGRIPGIRHAGVSKEPVQQIDMSLEYA